MMDTTNTTSAVRPVMTYFMAPLAVLISPCCLLPILILLLSGTAAVAFLAENIVLVGVLVRPVFLLLAIATWCLLGKNENDRQNAQS